MSLHITRRTFIVMNIKIVTTRGGDFHVEKIFHIA
jgi:hypothetical protein